MKYALDTGIHHNLSLAIIIWRHRLLGINVGIEADETRQRFTTFDTANPSVDLICALFHHISTRSNEFF